MKMSEYFNANKLPVPVQNQLFSAAVTGSTLEDYSQNAILLPATNLFPGGNHTSNTEAGSFPNMEQALHSSEQVSVSSQTQQPIVDLSTNKLIFDDFTNLTCNSSPSPTSTVSLNSGPLFEIGGQKDEASLPSIIPTLDTKESSKNIYRRSGTNKVTYAQVPGLLASSRTNTSNTHMVEPTSIPLVPQTSSSITPNNYFKVSQPASYSTPQFIPETSSDIYKLSGVNSPPPNLNSNDSKYSPETPPVFNPAGFFTPNTNNPPSSILSPVTISAKVSSSSPDMHTYTNKMEAVPDLSKTTLQKCRSAYHHWFFKNEIDSRPIWSPFSMVDSLALEEAFCSPGLNGDTSVATDGGRFDVNLLRRDRVPVYWTGKTTEVRRCSWFYKGSNSGRFTPFEENVAALLEEEYRRAFEHNMWNHKIELSNGESALLVGPDTLFLFPTTQVPDIWNGERTQIRPKLIKRGMDEFDIDEGESEKIDHLLFLVHGIGSACDLKFRSVEQVVDEFRSIAAQLLNSHYQAANNKGEVNRIEVLPISWHSKLHSEDTGIDKKLKQITLSSIPRLRDFTNDTLLDILLYTSPLYCQAILTSVGSELNRIFEKFQTRNPSFQGNVSLGGHSLGSLILFDLLCHQKKVDARVEENAKKECDAEDKPGHCKLTKMVLESGSGHSQLIFPQLNFQPTIFFALGSPIGMFLTIRGLEKLEDDFCFPTCPGFFNIFHPYDPVAYRIEPLINQQLTNKKPVLIPHHKGRKRLHLELKETVSRVGADLKHKFIDSVKSTWNTLFQTGFVKNEDESNPENEVQNEPLHQDICDELVEEINLGMLNNQHRIDYVLQEAPIEIFNEYIFALTSHVCYWESVDTILLILKEIYILMGILPDNLRLTTPQTAAVNNVQFLQPLLNNIPPSTSNSNLTNTYPIQGTNKSDQMGMDLTLPITSNTSLGPPPTSGFIRNSS